MSNKSFIIAVIIIVMLSIVPIVFVCVWDPNKHKNKSNENITENKTNISIINEVNDESNNEALQNSVNETEVENEVQLENIEKTDSEKESEPYIPMEFSHIDGSVNDGYVIQDNFGNEYVWIPVKDGKFSSDLSVNSNYKDMDSTVVEFKESVNKYLGFYIARYESSIYEDKTISDKYVSATIKNKTPWTNLMYSTAKNAAENSASIFKYTDCKTALVNSFAWDETMEWLNLSVDNYSTSISYGNYSGRIDTTGNTSTDVVNNIYDMAGNVKEWTTESYSDSSNNYRIVRGGNANLNKTASSRTNYIETNFENNLGFRMILYK